MKHTERDANGRFVKKTIERHALKVAPAVDEVSVDFSTPSPSTFPQRRLYSHSDKPLPWWVRWFSCDDTYETKASKDIVVDLKNGKWLYQEKTWNWKLWGVGATERLMGGRIPDQLEVQIGPCTLLYLRRNND
jgi:hypothetical protein